MFHPDLIARKEAAILKYLYRVGNKTVPRETLLDEVWGYNAGVTTHTLETHIYRLRQKIEPDPTSSRLLISVRRCSPWPHFSFSGPCSTSMMPFRM